MATLKINKPREKTPVAPTLPSEALDGLGGVLGEIMDYTLSVAPKPNRALAFAGAVAFLSLLCARRWRTRRNGRSPLYLIGLGNSAIGKDAAQKTNQTLAASLDMQSNVVKTFRSGEALEDAVLTKGRLLSQYDEIDTLFRQMGDGSSVAEQIMANMLSLWSDQGGYCTRRLLAQNAANQKSTVPNICYHPGFALYGCAVPQRFYEAINGRMATNGLFARLLIIHADPRQPPQDATFHSPPDKLIEELKTIANWTDKPELWMENTPGWKDTGSVIEMDEEAGAICRELAAEVETYFEEDELGPANALWGRALEKVDKLAMIFAVSRDPLNALPRINADDVRRAKAIVWQSTQYALELLGRYAAENDYKRDANKIKEILRGCKEKMPHSELLKKSGLKATDFVAIMETLLETGEVEMIEGDTLGNGKRPKYYSLGEGE